MDAAKVEMREDDTEDRVFLYRYQQHGRRTADTGWAHVNNVGVCV